MNPYFLGEAERDDKPMELLGQLSSVVFAGVGGVRVALDALPLRWAEDLWETHDGELDAERVSRFFETAPFRHLKFTLNWTCLQDLLIPSLRGPRSPSAVSAGLLGRWIAVKFDPSPYGQAVSYSSVSDSGTLGFVTIIDLAPRHLIRYLNQFTPLVTHVTPTHPDLQNAIGSLPAPHAMAVLDVGQGSANVMLSEQGRPIFYFDAGQGIGRNLRTTPAGLRFCTCTKDKEPVPVMISHWHEDHFAGTKSDPDLLKCTWITPPATTARLMSFQNGILAEGSKVLEMESDFLDFSFGSSGSYTLSKSKGDPNNPNESGHALMVTVGNKHWLLPADASYKNIELVEDRKFTAVVATHHGGWSNTTVIPDRAPRYARLVYSFGPDNSHGHPNPSSVDDHRKKWSHGNWKSPATIGVTTPGPAGRTRATAVNGVSAVPGPTSPHAGSVAIGWKGPPDVSPGGVLADPCPTCTKSFHIRQS